MLNKKSNKILYIIIHSVNEFFFCINAYDRSRSKDKKKGEEEKKRTFFFHWFDFLLILT